MTSKIPKFLLLFNLVAKLLLRVVILIFLNISTIPDKWRIFLVESSFAEISANEDVEVPGKKDYTKFLLN